MKRVPVCCRGGDANHPATLGRACGTSCVSTSARPTCPFKCKLSCASFKCSSLGLLPNGTTNIRARISMGIAGANGYTKRRMIRLCIRSGMTSIAHPVGRLGNFEGVRLGINRDGAMTFRVASSTLKFCSGRVGCVMRPNSFIFVINNDDSSMRRVACGLGR